MLEWIEKKGPEEWIDSYSQVSGIDAATQKLHLEMLNRISDKTLMAC